MKVESSSSLLLSIFSISPRTFFSINNRFLIMYLIQLIQYQHKQVCWLLNFICRYIPLKQWSFDDSHSPKYQKFRKRIENTSLSINASIRNALTTFTTSKRLIRQTSQRTMTKVNITASFSYLPARMGSGNALSPQRAYWNKYLQFSKFILAFFFGSVFHNLFETTKSKSYLFH